MDKVVGFFFCVFAGLYGLLGRVVVLLYRRHWAVDIGWAEGAAWGDVNMSLF
jgi:hypothetical protein